MVSYNPSGLLATQGLSIFAAFITFIAGCVFASMKHGYASHGEGFVTVATGIFSMTFLIANTYYLKKRQGRITYGYILSSAWHLILLNLLVGVWVGSKLNYLDSFKVLGMDRSYRNPCRGVIAGNALTIVFQVATLVQLFLFKGEISDESGSVGASSNPNVGYQSGEAASYQPEAYPDYSAGAGATTSTAHL